MLETSPDTLIQVIGTIALAIIILFATAKKLLKDLSNGNTENSVITIMHTELERMAKQNTALSLELGRLHTEVINLNHQLQALTVENQSLHLEISLLTEELSSLQALIKKGGVNAVSN